MMTRREFLKMLGVLASPITVLLPRLRVVTEAPMPLEQDSPLLLDNFGILDVDTEANFNAFVKLIGESDHTLAMDVYPHTVLINEMIDDAVVTPEGLKNFWGHVR